MLKMGIFIPGGFFTHNFQLWGVKNRQETVAGFGKTRAEAADASVELRTGFKFEEHPACFVSGGAKTPLHEEKPAHIHNPESVTVERNSDLSSELSFKRVCSVCSVTSERKQPLATFTAPTRTSNHISVKVRVRLKTSLRHPASLL